MREEAQLRAELAGPERILPGSVALYTVTLENAGLITAENVLATATLPYPLLFLSHTAPYPSSQ
ncbi:MAG: DUF11 domain-containing protein, partial [Thermoflexia bacterium]